MLIRPLCWPQPDVGRGHREGILISSDVNCLVGLEGVGDPLKSELVFLVLVLIFLLKLGGHLLSIGKSSGRT